MENIPNISQPWPGQGGMNSGLMRGENGKPDYYLIISTDDAGKHDNIEYGGYGIEEEGCDHKFDGQANTIALVKSNTPHPAAEFCAGVIIDGHNDYYLMSIHEEALARANCPELFDDIYYWSSTQFSAYGAWFQDFEDGTTYVYYKDDKRAVRAVRRYYPLSNSAI
jgi:hypothetical protein